MNFRALSMKSIAPGCRGSAIRGGLPPWRALNPGAAPAATAGILFLCIPASGEAAGGFRNVTERAGLNHTQLESYDPRVNDSGFVITGGGAVGDFFSTGRNDLFVTRHDATDIFYKNMGDGTFEDRTTEVFGVNPVDAPTNGALFADLDNDGHLDLYVTVAGASRHYLYMNDGQGRLIEQGRQRGAVNEQVAGGRGGTRKLTGMSVTAGDYTGNGFLDLYVSDWSDRTSPNRLLRNRGSDAPGYFEDVTEAAGLTGPDNRWGFGGRFADMNRNGLPDLVPYNDFGHNQFFWNLGDGTFREVAKEIGTTVGTFEMGISVDDLNNDGWLDIFLTDINRNMLYRNEMHRGLQGVFFTEMASQAGVMGNSWGWGAATLDYNNDGWRDLVMVNGWLGRTQPHFWRNNGSEDLSFTRVNDEVGIVEKGLGRGVIVADFTGDGWQDILILNHAHEPVLYENLGGENDWLRIDLVGKTSNRQGIGAWITVTPDLENERRQFVHEVNLEANFLSHSETTAHFGLGDLEGERVDRIHIRWPAGGEQEIYDVEPNRLHTIIEDPDPTERERFEAAAADAGLSRADARPDATPFGDGIENLLKYAFNMDLSGADRRALTPAGAESSGLPCIYIRDDRPVLVIEFLRRRNTDLIYTPKWSTDLVTWEPVTAQPVVIEIDSEWERAVVEIPPEPRKFGMVEVSLP